MLATAVPAYADVVTSDYTIGTPSVGVTSVVASPASVVEDASTTFNVTLTASTGLSGTSDSYVTVTPSEDLASPPVNVDLVGGSCIQSGTDGAGGTGLDAVNQLTVELGSSCSISAGQSVQVFFTADAPAGAGSFDFTVTTSANATLATSNTVTVGASAATLSAASYGFGANTTYTISDIPVTNLSTSTNTLLLTPEISGGTEVLTFYNGVPGYTVSYTPSGGSVIADLVEGVNVIGNSVSLTLENAVSNGDTLNITASGTNPAANGATQSNAIEVQPGNGSAQLTSTIAFGNSITGLSVSPSTLVGGASATYTVGFRASTTAGIGGDILLSETTGPTNFSAVTGVDVRDTTLGWNYVGSAVTLSDGLAEIEVNDTINAGDAITVTLASVTNPVTGTISDFKVSTTSDPVPAVAPPYTIGANGSAGVIVSVSPATASAIATYSISNLLASVAMTGGTSDITVDAPSGTVFPPAPVPTTSWTRPPRRARVRSRRWRAVEAPTTSSSRCPVASTPETGWRSTSPTSSTRALRRALIPYRYWAA